MAGDVVPFPEGGNGDDAAPVQADADAMGLPPEVVAIIGELQADAEKSGGATLSLARLSKRTQLRMSTLRRFLVALEEAGIVKVELNDDGTGSVQLLLPNDGA